MSDQEYLELALDQAKESVRQGGFPAGAVIVKASKVVASSISIGNILHDPTAHAESVAVREACKVLATTDLSGCTLYASLEPCMMCFCAANWGNISRIVYGVPKDTSMVAKRYYENNVVNQDMNAENTHKIVLDHVSGIESQMRNLIKGWEDQINYGTLI